MNPFVNRNPPPSGSNWVPLRNAADITGHVITRMDERATFEQDKTDIHNWVQTYPLVRKGEWYKLFGSLILAGEGSFAKTALKSHWTPRPGAQNLDSLYPPPAETQKWYYGYLRLNAAEPWKPQPRPQAIRPLKSSKLLMTAAEQQQFGFASEYTRPETPTSKIDWQDSSAKDLLEEWDGHEDEVMEIIKHFKGKHCFQYPEGDVYLVQGDVVDVKENASLWIYDDPMEFIATCDVDRYAPGDIEERFNETFWEECPTLYHASPEENIESILKQGIGTANKTRGMTNRGVGASVFTTTNEEYLEDGSYGDAIFEIDTNKMKAEGHTPFVSREPDQVEGDLRSALARRLGMEDRYYYSYEPGVDGDTVIVSGGIPATCLKLISGQEIDKTASKTAAAGVKIPKELAPLVEEAKNYATLEEFVNAVNQSDLTDLSNYALHRWGRAIPRDAEEAGNTIKDSVAAIESSNPSYMEDLSSEPEVLGAIKNGSRSITIYRAVPPTTEQIIGFFDDEMRKWRRLGNRGEYPFRDKMRRFVPAINESNSGYFNWLYEEVEKLKAGTSRFKGVDDPAIKIGDFVTLNRSYAKEHGEATLVGQQGYPTFKIVSKRVPKTDVIWNGDDWKEWAYSPQKAHTITLQDVYAAAHGGKVDKQAEAKPLGISEINAIIREYMPILYPGLPIPKLKIVNNTGSTWNGRDTWHGSEPDNTQIDIQKACTYDETTVRRIIAHELCHHEVFLTVYRYMSLTERKYLHDGHGKEWQEVAKRFNDRFGKDFVTKVSDQNIVVSDTGKPYLLLVADLKGNGDLWFCYCSRPSNKQQRFINTKLEQGARLFKVTDPEWSRRGSPVGDAWGGLRKGKDDESIAKLRKLWDEGEQLPPFQVVESQKEKEQRELLEKWRQYGEKKRLETKPLTPEEENMSDDELLAALSK